ncbi:DUF3429 domain-containing protein [Roseovarius dicentrarchi]|uniref:DUF3429 domain-containing protein n=1 Tax=Roseovarius dicentrarchi TaxID=2250573 RepID=UPI000DEB6780|nr:DUF3429 domain-containing protein [Roseovarius dicentrarchi]
MTGVPRSALILGLAGLIPFLWGAITILQPGLADWTIRSIGPRFAGPYVMLFYGAIILAFMSGVLWGFATKLEGNQAAVGYVLSVIPALWAFFTTGGGPVSAGMSLMAGFAGLLGIDWLFWRFGVAPEWWMQLRVLLTAIVLGCLAVAVFL